MKIRKSTIVWMILALFMFGAASYEDESEGPTWKDATYVQDAKVLPENEGKLVAVSGQPVPLKNAVNEITGTEFPSPRVYQEVEYRYYVRSEHEWEWSSTKEATFSDGITLKTGYLIGRIGLGEFELDEELIKRLCVLNRNVEKKDFSEEDIAKMEESGHPQNLTADGYRYRSEDYDYRVGWWMWVPDEKDRVTVVGIQKGNTLVYCEELHGGLSSEDEYMDEIDFQNKIQTDETVKKYTPYIVFVLAVLCLIMAIRSLFQKKKSADATQGEE